MLIENMKNSMYLIFVLFVMFSLVFGCSYSSTSSMTITEVTIQKTLLDRNHSVKTTLSMPVSGLFVGVSNYQPDAGVQPTMAHTVSASLMYSLLGELGFSGESIGNSDTEKFSEHTLNSGDTYLTLLADLRANPERDKKQISNLKASISNILFVYNDYDPDFDQLNSDGTFGYVGKGKLVTKKRIVNSLSDHLNNYYDYVSKKNKEMLFYLYVSSHGFVSDGRSFLVPADGRLDDKESLISYSELLGKVYETQQKLLENESIDVIPQIIVVIDACQNILDDRGAKSLVDIDNFPHPPAGVSVLFSTSPGQYAYHWENVKKVKSNVLESEFSGFSFGIDTQRPLPVGKYEADFSSKISAFPVSTIWGFNRILEFYEDNISEFSMYQDEVKRLKASLSPEDFYFEMMAQKAVYDELLITYSIPRDAWVINKKQFLSISEQALPKLLVNIDAPVAIQQKIQRLDSEIFVNSDLIVIE